MRSFLTFENFRCISEYLFSSFHRSIHVVEALTATLSLILNTGATIITYNAIPIPIPQRRVMVSFTSFSVYFIEYEENIDIKKAYKKLLLKINNYRRLVKSVIAEHFKCNVMFICARRVAITRE